MTDADKFEQWLKVGVSRGWCGPAVCNTHDGIPMSEDEDERFESGEDPCVHIVRLYPDARTRTAVESNHPPSLWRNT